MDQDDCLSYICAAFIFLVIIALFWQLIIILSVIVFATIFVFVLYGFISDRSTKRKKKTRRVQRDWTSSYPYDNELYGDESYEDDWYESPKRDSQTYIDPNGYKRYSDSDRLVHRHIAEVYVVRRKLTDDEVVHHINGNKLDNRSKNLRVMTWKEHKDLHDR